MDGVYISKARARGVAPTSGLVNPLTRSPSSSNQLSGFLKAVAGSRSSDLYTQQISQQTLIDHYKSEFRAVEKAALSESSGPGGGYLVPQQLTQELMDGIMAEENIILPRAYIVPMFSAEMQVPLLDVVTGSGVAGITPLFGNLQFQWGPFSPTIHESEPTYRGMSLKPHDLIGFCTVSNQWLADATPEGESRLVKTFSQAAGWYIDYAFFQGTGYDQPLGVLNSTGRKNVTRSTGNHITQTDLANMGAGLLPYSWRNALWACSPTALAQIQQVTGYYVNTDQKWPGAAGVLNGRPLYCTEKLPALGTVGDLVFIDPSLYVVGQRLEVLVDVSAHTLFQNFQTVFRIWMRYDGRPINSGLITLQDNSTTVSPMVVLN